MYALSRVVRLSLQPDRRQGGPAAPHPGSWCEIGVTCRGLPDPVTGYLLNISEIDRAVRAHAVDVLRDAVAGWWAGSSRSVAAVLPRVADAIGPALGGTLASVTWRLSPYHFVTMDTDDRERVTMSRRFEFSAAHRLHCAGLSDRENRDRFGKCNNPSGHGHNYKLEVTASVPMEQAETPFGFDRLERLVDELVIQRFDHKHLNIDTVEFASLNPSVENIARVCYDLLAEPVAVAGALLQGVTVWETDKTSCTYEKSPQRSAISHQQKQETAP